MIKKTLKPSYHNSQSSDPFPIGPHAADKADIIVDIVDPDSGRYGAPALLIPGPLGDHAASKNRAALTLCFSQCCESGSASICRWPAKMYGKWAYLSIFWGFEPLFGSKDPDPEPHKWKVRSESASKWQAGSGSASKLKVGTESASKWCGSATLAKMLEEIPR